MPATRASAVFLVLATAFSLFWSAPVARAGDAAGIVVEDAYLLISRPNAPAAAVFMMLRNNSSTDDRLIGAASDLARRVEIHTHIADDDGVMRMREVEGGLRLPAGGMHMLQRGGDHVMLMGLTGGLEQGDMAEITLIFETAGEITVTVPVEQERKAGATAGHGSHSN